MTQAKIDNNNIKTLIGQLNTDGVTPTLVKADPTTHAISADDNTTGSDLSGDIAKRDDNREPTQLAVSNADGITPVPLYVDSDGKLLIQST